MIYGPDGTPIFTKDEMVRHHPWCNHYHNPSEGCKMCEDLYGRFPLVPDMIKTYFPNTIGRTK